MMQYAKAISTALGTGLSVAVAYYPHASWIPIATAVLTVMATYAIPNTPKMVTAVEVPKDSERTQE